MKIKFNKTLFLQLKKYCHNILHSEMTPHNIAFAVALGFFIACVVPLGVHTIVVLILAFVLRIDRLLAFAATWIINPYTIPVIYPVFCFIGSRFTCASKSFYDINKIFVTLLKDFSLANLMKMGKGLMIAFFVGGFICGMILGIIGYLITYKLVIVYRQNRGKRVYNKLLLT